MTDKLPRLWLAWQGGCFRDEQGNAIEVGEAQDEHNALVHHYQESNEAMPDEIVPVAEGLADWISDLIDEPTTPQEIKVLVYRALEVVSRRRQ